MTFPTIEEVTAMNPQQIFDYVARHLNKQGRSATDGEFCKYRADDGGSCAVGCLMPESVYSPAFEEKGVAVVSLTLAGTPFGKFLTDNYKLLVMLQYVHDSTQSTVEGWHTYVKRRLSNVAQIFNLSDEVLKEFP